MAQVWRGRIGSTDLCVREVGCADAARVAWGTGQEKRCWERAIRALLSRVLRGGGSEGKDVKITRLRAARSIILRGMGCGGCGGCGSSCGVGCGAGLVAGGPTAGLVGGRDGGAATGSGIAAQCSIPKRKLSGFWGGAKIMELG